MKDILENDTAVSLRESLRGPVDLHQPDNGQWNYTYTFGSGDLTVPFSNLGLALLCENANDPKAREILQLLIKQPSFVPEAVDFESLIKVCRGSGRTLFMKIIVQSYSMQFIFSSYPLEAQRRIVRLLLGYTPDGTAEIFPMFDDKFTLAKPYHLFVLHEITENVNHSQMKDITQKLN